MLLLIALAIVLAVAWMLRSAADIDLTRSAAPTQAPAEQHNVLVDEAASRSARSALEVAPADSEPSGPKSAEATSTPRETIEVLVLDLHSHEPVAGAEVRWVNSAELGLPANPREYGVSHDPGRILRRVDPVLPRDGSRLATTDERGLAHVDTRVFPGRVSAIRGAWSGSVNVGDRVMNPIRVHVTEQSAIPIQVVDGAGAPVPGVPVSLRENPVVDKEPELWLGTTDENGLVHAELARPRSDHSARWTVHACLEIPLDRPVSSAVNLGSTPIELVRLVLPPCGSVVIGVREEGGRTAHRFHAGLRCAPSGTRVVCEELAWSLHAFDPARIVGDEAHFPFVGLGLQVDLFASRHNGYVRWARSGPKAAGEVLRFDFELAGNEPEVTGRFLTEDGEPLRERLVQIVFGSRQLHRFRYPLQTDGDGRFRFFATLPGTVVFPPQPKEPGMHGHLLAMPIGIGPGEGGSVRTAVEVESLDAAHDVGDLIVVAPRIVGSGSVVDDLGSPVAWPQLGVFAPSANSETGWYPNEQLRAVPHADGRFEIVASTDFARIRVLARAPPRAESNPIEFEPGAGDLRLVTPRACEIAGRVLVDEGVYESGIRVHAIGPGPRVDSKNDHQRRVEGGAFLFQALAPGRYDVEFRRLALGMKEEFVHRIEGIEVPPAGKAVDARLDAIDLRGMIAVPQRR